MHLAHIVETLIRENVSVWELRFVCENCRQPCRVRLLRHLAALVFVVFAIIEFAPQRSTATWSLWLLVFHLGHISSVAQDGIAQPGT